MERRTFFGLIIAAVLVVCTAAIIFFGGKPAENSSIHGFRTTFPVMGTVASFTLYAADETAFVNAANAGKKEFDRVVALANLYDRNSDALEDVREQQARRIRHACN